MYPIEKCKKVGQFYLGESTEEKSVGYLELQPHTSLNIHNRLGGIENLTQIKGECVMVIFDEKNGKNYKLLEGDKLSIKPEGAWHIHSNPFDKISITYWQFDGDIRHIIDNIKNK